MPLSAASGGVAGRLSDTLFLGKLQFGLYFAVVKFACAVLLEPEARELHAEADPRLDEFAKTLVVPHLLPHFGEIFLPDELALASAPAGSAAPDDPLLNRGVGTGVGGAARDDRRRALTISPGAYSPTPTWKRFPFGVR